MFDHEKLDVYRASIELVALTDRLAKSIDTRHRNARDQLVRSTQSIPLNIAEGNGKRAFRDRNRYFEIARGAAMESAAAFDILRAVGAAEESDIERPKQLLHRIVSMLYKMTVYRNNARETSTGYGIEQALFDDDDDDDARAN